MARVAFRAAFLMASFAAMFAFAYVQMHTEAPSNFSYLPQTNG